MSNFRTVRHIPVEDLVVEDDLRHDPERIDADLVASIRDQGVIQPLTVKREGSGPYVVLDGRRRLRHARAAGLRTVPCLLRGTDSPLAEFLLEIEANLHRADWSPVEIARIAERMAEEHGWTQAQIADWLSERSGESFSRAKVTQYLALLRMTDEALAAVAEGTFPFSWGRQLARLNDDPTLQRHVVRQLLDEIAAAAAKGREHALSVRAIAARIDKLLTPPELLAEAREEAEAARAAAVYEAGRESKVESQKLTVESRGGDGGKRREGEKAKKRIGEDMVAVDDPVAASYLMLVREAVGYLAEAGRLDEVQALIEQMAT